MMEPRFLNKIKKKKNFLRSIEGKRDNTYLASVETSWFLGAFAKL